MSNDRLRVPIGDDGKYTVVMDSTGYLYAMRHGKAWRECVGDGLILAMASDIEELRGNLRDANKRAATLADQLRDAGEVANRAEERLAMMAGDASTATALSDVAAERCRQDAKWGQQNHTPVKWSAILSEEVGEFAAEALDFDGPISPDTIAKMRAEAVQVAAVAVAIVECIDRGAPRGAGATAMPRPDIERRQQMAADLGWSSFQIAMIQKNFKVMRTLTGIPKGGSFRDTSEVPHYETVPTCECGGAGLTVTAVHGICGRCGGAVPRA